jgi:predicted glycoside hydrolase/deacetylase ChbG (UPF0249 family)
MSGTYVINADDFGISRGATLGIIRSHLEGVVTSASLTPAGVDYVNAVELAKARCPELGIGLHFTLSAGKAVSAPHEIPDLVDDQGNFCWEFVSLLKTLRLNTEHPLLQQIDTELEAQIQKLLSDGIRPDHINGERHVHLIPGIFRRVVAAANRHGIPFVRAGQDITLRLLRPNNASQAFFHGGILKYLLLNGLTLANGRVNKQVRSCDYFASYIFTGRLDLVIPRILQHQASGVTEIMVHPGLPEHSSDLDLGNPGLEQYLVSEDRRLELQACIRAKDRIQGVTLSTFGKLARS